MLEFKSEHPLTAEPLRVDVIIIKKPKEAVIEKNIAAIFRECNVIEYKSPDDSLRVADFHKVLAYDYLYAAQNGLNVTDTTITFAVSKYPKKVIGHLRKAYRFELSETSCGIYEVRGDIMPIQIVVTKELADDTNIWLKSLSNELDVGRMIRVMAAGSQKRQCAYIRAYMHMLLQANVAVMKEVLNMQTLSVE